MHHKYDNYDQIDKLYKTQLDSNNKKSYSNSIIREMARTVSHRGPDSEGFWEDVPEGIAMGFRRLAILDITPNGNQPMISHSGQFIIVFNGEIYNYKELKSKLLPKREKAG